MGGCSNWPAQARYLEDCDDQDMPENSIDFVETLRAQRAQYLEWRQEAERLSKVSGDSPMGAAMAEQCRILDAAIANIDTALRCCGGSSDF
jgi:hypothetical protein